MKRLGLIVFLCGLVISGQAYGMSESDKQRYLDWLKTLGGSECALAVAPNGCWASEPAVSTYSALRDNDGVLDASQLFSQLRPKVMVNSDQTPEYGDIHRAGHDGGDFLFVRQ